MPKTVACPICGKPVRFGDPNMPFCSDRCRVVDLGNWASEKYVIGSSNQEELESNEDLPTHPEGSE